MYLVARLIHFFPQEAGYIYTSNKIISHYFLPIRAASESKSSLH